MALQKQNLPLSIVDGLDTKTDEKNVLATKWLVAENVDYTKTGAVNKRSGHSVLTNKVDGDDDIGAGRSLSTLGDELVLYSQSRLFTYSPSKNKWYNRGFVSNAVNSEMPIIVAGSVPQTHGYEVIQNVGCFAYSSTEDGDEYVTIRLVDLQSGSVLADHTVPGVNMKLKRVGRVGNSFIILYQDGGDLMFRRIDFANVRTLSSATTMGTIVNGSAMDSAVIGNRLYVIWAADNGLFNPSDITVSYIRPDFTAPAGVVVGSAASGSPPVNMNISAENLTNVRVLYKQYTGLLSYDLNTIYHNTIQLPPGSSTALSTAVQDPENSAQSYIFYNEIFTGANQISTSYVTIDQSGTMSAPTVAMYGVNPVSKPQAVGSQIYLLVNKRASNSLELGQRGYFLISKNGDIVSKAGVGVAPKSLSIIGDLLASGESLTFFGSEYYEFFKEDNPSPFTSTNLKLYTYDFSVTNNFYDATLGRQLHVNGGVMSSYDSNAVTEHGFLEIPITPILDTSVGTAPNAGVVDVSPSIGVGSSSVAFPQTVQYCAVYAWVDSKGQIHRSAPSIPLSVTIPDDNREVYLRVFPLTLTSKRNVEIEIYRTEGNGTTFYKVSNSAGLLTINNSRVDNDPSLYDLSFRDIMPDQQLISRELLYATDGVLENIAPISSRFLTSHKNRIFLLSSDGTQLQFSKLHEDNVGVEFNDALILKLNQYGLEARALASLDDNLIILHRRALYVLTRRRGQTGPPRAPRCASIWTGSSGSSTRWAN